MTAARWVRAGSQGPPLVATHTWRDEASLYACLADALGDRTIYSLLPPTAGVDRMPRRVDEWVDHHEAALATIDAPEDGAPYRFVGWSFGGVVALELARRLRARGVQVAFVGLIDSIRPILRPLDDRAFVWQSLATAAALPDGERFGYLRRRLAFLAVRRFPRTVGATHGVWRRLTGREAGHEVVVKPTDPLVVAVHSAYLNYHGEPVDFPVHLYGSRASCARAREPALRWLPWLHGGYSIATVPGEHFTLFRPEHVDGLAAALTRDLASVD